MGTAQISEKKRQERARRIKSAVELLEVAMEKFDYFICNLEKKKQGKQNDKR